MYLILTYLPFMEGGGYFSISGNIISLSLDVVILFARFANTFAAALSTSSILCLFITEVNIIGMSLNGAIRSEIFWVNSFIVFVPLSSIVSHLLTTITQPFLF